MHGGETPCILISAQNKLDVLEKPTWKWYGSQKVCSLHAYTSLKVACSAQLLQYFCTLLESIMQGQNLAQC